MKRILCLTLVVFTALLAAADKPYDFRSSDAYRQLSTGDKQRLEQVRRDQVLLWGALDMFADEHGGNPPEALDELVPHYLAELPSDPFATAQTRNERRLGSYTASKEGRGYRFQRGAPGNRAWVIMSVGLPDFPYPAAQGNVGLYVCKGLWLGGVNPVVGSLFKGQSAGGPDEAANPRAK